MPADMDIPIALKATLVDDRGVPYREFRKTLTPRYGRVWRDIGLAYLALVLVVGGLATWNPALPLAIVAGVVGALLVGYFFAFLNNFFHEATHDNLARGRERNDLLANLALGWLFGSSIGTYRQIHFQHHRALGTTEDSENSYFDPLRVRYLAEGLFGLKVLRTLRRYREVEKARGTSTKSKEKDESGSDRLLWMVISAVMHLTIAAALWLLAGSPVAAIAWVAGVLLCFPFFVSLRQLLEHRSEDAQASVDYHLVDHGKVNRLFGDGPLASTLGSAGFNRHALHHWEPNVSYTRLKDMERYLEHTEAADILRDRSTTYTRTFLRLLEL